jgi:hypothetical protein
MNASIESSGIFSILCGLWGCFGGPILLSVLGGALGVNAILKERNRKNRSPIQKYIGIVGCTLCVIATLLFFVGRAFSSR